MTTKTNYALLAVTIAAVVGLATAPTMQSALATTTTWYTSFTDGNNTCLHGFPSSLNSATSNSDGDLTTDSDTNSSNHYGQATAFAYEEKYFSQGTSVTLTAYGTIDLDAQGGTTNAIAYLAKPGTIYYNPGSGCVSNGAAVTGSIANLGTATGSNDQESGYKVTSSGSFTIPTSGTYFVVVYVDANTNYDGTVTGEVENPTVKLVY